MVVDMEFGIQLSPHPLLMDHIIEQLLEYISEENLSELFNLRLLCHQWNYHATRLLQKKYYLSFGGHKYNIGRLKTFLDEFDSMKKYEKSDSKSSQEETPINTISGLYPTFPVTRFRLFSDLFQETNKAAVINFMKKCGPTVESLVIYKDINSDIEYTPEELTQFHFPRLQELSFSDRRRSQFSLDANQQSFLYHVVSSSSKTLTSLAIKFPREPIYEIYEKEELLIKILTTCDLSSVKSLKLDMSITDKILNTLSEKKLKLKGLQLCLGASQFSSKSLNKFLESLKYTLEDLKFSDLYRRAVVSIDLPDLPGLKSFEVHGIELPAYFISFPNFSYEGRLPNLRRLRLNTWAPTTDWEVFVPEIKKDANGVIISSKPNVISRSCKSGVNNGTTCVNIRELALAMNFDCPILVKRVTGLFTGVRKLEMHFSRGSVEALRKVFEFMPQLEELKLNQSYLAEMSTNCIDDVLTGLDAEECKWILKRKAYRGVDLGLMEKKPNLLDLKSKLVVNCVNLADLKKLDMLGLRYRNIMTDVSGHLIFLKMEKLRTLDIGRSELSDHCLRELAEKFPNGKFKKYLTKKRMKPYDSGLYKNSVFTSICSVQ